MARPQECNLEVGRCVSWVWRSLVSSKPKPNLRHWFKMSDTEQHCPVCGNSVEQSARYPRYVCLSCARGAVDEAGRRLKFSNESFSGGFVARYEDTGEVRDSHICYVRGVRCWADEAHMGGIVIQPADKNPWAK